MRAAIAKDRRTSAEIAHDHLKDEILSLKLLPGTKISEAEIAARLGLSRQPVREAFARLDNSDLLLVRPQKATIVRKFSLEKIAAARFTRRAVELEVLHDAIKHWDGSLHQTFKDNLAEQQAALAAQDARAFHRLDIDFHMWICRAAKAEFAFDTIADKKAQIARLCVLSLTQSDEMADLIADHTALVERMAAKDREGAADMMRHHLSRLDVTVQSIFEDHAQYFEEPHKSTIRY